MKKKIWKSPITPSLAAGASVRLSGLAAGAGAAAWIEGRPAEGGRGVIVGAGDGAPRDVLAAPYSARSRVHEYGGGALLADGSDLYFVNHADQDLYRLGRAGGPERLSDAPGLRFADMAVDRARNRLVCVSEDAGRDEDGEDAHPENFLSAVGIGGADKGKVTVLVRGADFYAAPRVSPDGTRLAWLEWDLPHMPWEAARLCCAELDAAGTPGAARHIAGGAAGAAFQPAWMADGRLTFVVEGAQWSGLHVWDGAAQTALFCPEAELLRPLWAFDLNSYVHLGDGRILAAPVRDGEQELWLVSADGGAPRQIDLPHRWIEELAAGAGAMAYAIVHDDNNVPAVCAVDLAPEPPRWTVLSRPGALSLPAESLSIGVTRRFETAGGTVPALYYPPRNADHHVKDRRADGPPPMIVTAHGGPTGAATRGLVLRTQFWTSRGFAVLDVDYRGSTGYGRAHREALQGCWGELDADDAIAAAEAAVAAGLGDADRLVITGRSAGGFTALCALMRSRLFKAASVHFGVADLETLLATTHKFEAGYLYGLTGTSPGQTEPVFTARSPLAQAERIASPVLLLQGLEDPAVPPEQARAIAASLGQRGVPVAHMEFAGEGHGFRQAETIETAFLADLTFFLRVLGLESEEPLIDLTIRNEANLP